MLNSSKSLGSARLKSPFAAVSCAPKCLLPWSSCCYRWKHTSLQFIPKTNQPNEGLVSEVPIIFVWEQNTWQSCPVLSPSVSWYAVFFLLGSMKLFDTKYGKHANLEPSVCCLYCHSIPAGKKKKKTLQNNYGRRKAFQSPYIYLSFWSFANWLEQCSSRGSRSDLNYPLKLPQMC